MNSDENPLSSGNFVPGSGSYGSGVRAQVFEVLVRQALADAPWKELCVGPMRVNNISPEEVEIEVERRRGEQGGPGGSATSPVPRKPKPSAGTSEIALPLPPSK